MKIRQAVRILKREREFLSISWRELFILCREESSALKLATLDAYDAYEKHMQDHMMLESILDEFD